MLIEIPGVLDADTVASLQEALQNSDWEDGRGSAGYLSRAVKRNAQLPDHDPLSQDLGNVIRRALDQNSMFTSAALPAKMVPPLFNRYADNQHYGRHVDGAIRPVAGSSARVRTDISATLFLSPPDEYDGGALIIEDTFGTQRVKLEAGSMVLYPGSSVHKVEPVTRGVRLASFFWIQSMVRAGNQRRVLFELDTAIQKIAVDSPDHEALVDLAAVYHNLLRDWADC